MLYTREIFNDAKDWLEEDRYLIFTGARQTGKTSILILLKQELERKGHPVFYFNLENPEYLELLDKHPFNIFELLPFQSRSKEKQYVIIDEIQYLKKPTQFLKLLFDEHRNRIKIIASGSSSFYIDTKFSDSLAGRKILFEVYPLNFDEFLFFHEQQDLLQQKHLRLSAYYKKQLMTLWRQYSVYGGYPEVVLAEDDEIRRIILQDIVSYYIKKDIQDAGIRNSQKYFALLKIFAQQTGSLVNAQELAKTLRMTHKTVHEYSYVMEKSYHVGFIRPFYRNMRKELTKMPKVYFYDLGVRNTVLNNFSVIDQRVDKGAVLENIAFRELLYKTKDIHVIHFWQTQDQKEVDFVVNEKAYEIKYDLQKVKEKKYKQFQVEYPEISFDFFDEEKILKEFYGWNW